eukprot:8080279-Alexandrium_andersonii.AAC.1
MRNRSPSRPFSFTKWRSGRRGFASGCRMHAGTSIAQRGLRSGRSGERERSCSSGGSSQLAGDWVEREGWRAEAGLQAMRLDLLLAMAQEVRIPFAAEGVCTGV